MNKESVLFFEILPAERITERILELICSKHLSETTYVSIDFTQLEPSFRKMFATIKQLLKTTNEHYHSDTFHQLRFVNHGIYLSRTFHWKRCWDWNAENNCCLNCSRIHSFASICVFVLGQRSMRFIVSMHIFPALFIERDVEIEIQRTNAA